MSKFVYFIEKIEHINEFKLNFTTSKKFAALPPFFGGNAASFALTRQVGRLHGLIVFSALWCWAWRTTTKHMNQAILVSLYVP